MSQYDEFTLAVRTANPIETFIGSYLSLKKRGRTYVCNCPFHSEKTPSFTVFTDTQSFYCFGCGKGGDVITFAMNMENLDFIEAVKFLAEKSGIPIPEYSGRNTQNAQKRTQIYEMNRITANFFYVNLLRGKNPAGLEYFRHRGLAPATIKKYGLGYASDSWNELTDMLLSKGYSKSDIVDAGLGKFNKKGGGIHDVFRNRVMFPIVDLRGNVIGFGGRVLDGSEPKYLNTGATAVFDKGKNLFSLNHAKNSNLKKLILCEGYMDVIAVNQAGFENVVATLGTAITADQARLMKRYADEVVIAYDSDGAGQKATKKAIRHLSDADVKTSILHIEGAKDPDEYIKKFGRERFGKLVNGSVDANNFMIDNCEKDLDITTEAGKVELLKRVARVIADMPTQIEREVYISRTARKYDFPVNVLHSYIDNIVRKNDHNAQTEYWNNVKANTISVKDELNPEAAKYRDEARAEEYIISYLLKYPEDYDRIGNSAPKDIFVTSFNARVYASLLDTIRNTEHFSTSLLNEVFSGDEVGKIIGITVKNKDFTDNDSFNRSVDFLKKRKNAPMGDDISDEILLSLYNTKKN